MYSAAYPSYLGSSLLLLPVNLCYCCWTLCGA